MYPPVKRITGMTNVLTGGKSYEKRHVGRKRGLPVQLVCYTKDPFLDLSKDELLHNWLHRKTQNQSESFSGMECMEQVTENAVLDQLHLSARIL